MFTSVHVLFLLESQTLRYIQEKVCSHEGDVKALTDQLLDSVSHQVQEFAAIPLDRLQSASSGMLVL